MTNIDSLINTKIYVDDKWVIARLLKDNRLFQRIIDAVLVLLTKQMQIPIISNRIVTILFAGYLFVEYWLLLI